MSMLRLNALARHLVPRRVWQWATPLLAPGLAIANPAGGDVVLGDVAISNTDPNTLTLDQSSATAAINWQNFSIGANEYVIFNQPSASALALNRVVGGTPSEIFGHLLANGRIFLVNPSGVLFGQNATVDVGALMVSTANISDADFAAGRFVFTGASDAPIVNDGHIIAGPGGFVVLAADSVSNTGLIEASLGQVVLASGNAFTLDLTGEGLINFAVDQAALSDRAGVENLGQIVADGGKVLMTAKTAADLARTVVNNEGLIQARSIADGQNGEIILSASGGDIANSGTLDASGINGQAGGTISLVGDRAVRLAATSVIDTHGDGLASGGRVHLSGHTVAVRGLLNVGRGGSFLLDPTDLTIKNGSSGSGTGTGSSFVFENTIESLLQNGTNVTITASRSIVMEDLADNQLNGVDGSAGSDDGSLTLGIGGQSSSAFIRGPGQPGGGIKFLGANDTVLVGRSLKIVAGSGLGNGGIDVGDLTAGGDVLLDAASDVKAGAITAGGGVKVYTAEGDVALGNVSAKGYASIEAAHGNLILDDVSVTQNGAGLAHAFLAAYGSGASFGNILDRDATDTITVANNAGAASFFASGQGNVDLNNVVVHGGGGSSSGVGSAAFRMANVTVHAGNDLFLHQADIATQPFHVQGSASGSSFVRNDAGARVSLDAGHDLVLGDRGTGVNVAGYGGTGSSSGSQFGVDVLLGAGHDLELHNVTLKSGAVTSSRHFARSNSFSASSGSSNDFFATLRFDASAGNNLTLVAGGALTVHGNAFVQVNGNAGGDVVIDGTIAVDGAGGSHVGSRTNHFTSGSYAQSAESASHYADVALGLHANDDLVLGAAGAISVAVPGDIRVSLGASDVGTDSAHGVAIDGAIGIAATPRFQSSDRATHSAGGAVLSRSHSAVNEGLATLDVQAGGTGNVMVGSGATISVAGAGRGAGRSPVLAAPANTAAHVSLGASGDVSVAGTITVAGTRAHYEFSSHSGATDRASGGSVGEARLDINARHNVGIAPTAVLAVSGDGGAALNVTAGESDGYAGNVTFDGDATVTAGNAAFHATYHRTSGSSFGQSSASSGSDGSAHVGLSASNHLGIGSGAAITIAGTHATLDGDAGWNSAASGGIAMDGTIVEQGHFGLGYFNHRQDRFGNSFSSGSGGQTHRPQSVVQLVADRGDVVLSGGISAEGYGDVRVALDANASDGDVIVGGPVRVVAHAAGSSGTYHSFDAGSGRNNSYGGAQVAGSLELHAGRDVIVSSGASVAVTADGHAQLSVRAGRDVDFDGNATVTARAAATSGGNSSYASNGSGHSHSSAGSFGMAEAHLDARGDVNVGAGATLTLAAQGRGQVYLTAGNSSGAGDVNLDGQVVVTTTAGSNTAVDRSFNAGGITASNFRHETGGDATAFVNAYDLAGSAGSHGDVNVGAGGALALSGIGLIDSGSVANAANVYVHAARDLNVAGALSAYGEAGAASASSFGPSFSGGQRTFGGTAAVGFAGMNLQANRDITIDSGADVSVHGVGIQNSGPVGLAPIGGGAPGGGAALSLSAGRFATVDGQVTVDAQAGTFNVHHGFTHAGSYGTSADQASAGSARLDISGDGVSIGGTLTVTAPGEADASITAYNGGGVTIDGTLAVTGNAGSFASSGSTTRSSGVRSHATSGHRGNAAAWIHAYSGSYGAGDVTIGSSAAITIKDYGGNAGSPAARLDVYASGDIAVNGALTLDGQRGSFHSHHSAPNSSGASYGDAGGADLSLYAQGAIALGSGASVNVNAAGQASVTLDAGGDLTVSAPITVGATRGFHSGGHTSAGSSSNGYGSHFSHYRASHQTASSGSASALLRSRGGSVTLNAPLSVSAAGYASANLRANDYNGGTGALNLNAPVSVVATPGTFAGSHHSYGQVTHQSSSAAPATTVSQHRFDETGSGSHGSAQATLFAWGNVNQASDAPVTVTGAGAAAVSVTADRGNVAMHGGITVTATAAHHAHASDGSNRGATSLNSYGSTSDGSYGSASIRVDAYRDSGSGVGNVTLGTLQATGAGNASIQAAAHSSGALAVEGPVTVTSGRGHFTQSRHHLSSGSNFNSSYGQSAGSLGYGSVSLFGSHGVSVTGAISVTGEGFAGASLEANAGGVDAGDITVTGNKGTLSGTHFGHYRSGSYETRNSGSDSSAVGRGELRVRAYGGGNVDLSGNVTVIGFGSNAGGSSYGLAALSLGSGLAGGASASLYASSGSVGAGNVTVTAQRGTRDGTFHNFYSPSATYASSGDGAVHNSAGEARVNVSGYHGVHLSGVTVSAPGGAFANVSAGSGGVTIDGPVSVVATRGALAGSSVRHYHYAASDQSYLSSHDSSYGSAGLRVDGASGVTLASATVTAAGVAHASLDASSGAVSASGPIQVTATKGARSYRNEYHRVTDAGASNGSFSDVTASYGAANLDVAGSSGVSLAGVTVTGDGYAHARIQASSSAAVVDLGGPVSLTANAGSSDASSGNSFHNSAGAYGMSRTHDTRHYGSASLEVYAYSGAGIGAGQVTVSGAGSANASFYAESGAVSITGPVAVSATAGTRHHQHSGSDHNGSYASHQSSDNQFTRGTAMLDVWGGSGVTMSGFTVAGAGVASASISAGSGNVTISGPVTLTATAGQHTQTRSNAFGYSIGGGTYSYGSAQGSDFGSASLEVRTSNGNVTMGAVTASAPGAASVTVNANGTVTLTGPASVSATRGQGSGSWHQSQTSSGRTSSGHGMHSDSAGDATLDLYGAGGVTMGGLTVTADGDAQADISATSGDVTIGADAVVTATRGQHAGSSFHHYVNAGGQAGTNSSQFASSEGNARLRAYSESGAIAAQGITVSAPGSASASLDASSGAVTVAGPVTITATRGTRMRHEDIAYTSSSGFSSTQTRDSSASYGAAGFTATGGGGATLSGAITVAGAGAAHVTIGSGAFTVGAPVTIDAGSGQVDRDYVRTASGSTASSSHFHGPVGDASLQVNGLVPLGSTSLFTVAGQLANVDIRGVDVHLGGDALMDNLVASAADVIDTGYGGMSYLANAASMRAGTAIDLSGGTLGLGTGAASFGADDIAEFLLHVLVPGIAGNIEPNGAFSAPTVSFGGLQLGGTAIYIQADAVHYSAPSTDINITTPPPLQQASGYVIRYDTYTPDATIHIVDTLPGTPVAGDVYYDASDFQYPGTTYLVGASLGFSTMIIGDGVSPPPGGFDPGDNFVFLTNTDASFFDPIPTTGQVFVIHPLATLAALTQQPISTNFDLGTSTDGEDDGDQKDSLEHEQQPQTGGGGEGEEGAVDQHTNTGLECH